MREVEIRDDLRDSRVNVMRQMRTETWFTAYDVHRQLMMMTTMTTHTTRRLVDVRDGSDGHDDEELANKTVLQNALVHHLGIYSERLREENDGHHPFVYRGLLIAQQRLMLSTEAGNNSL